LDSSLDSTSVKAYVPSSVLAASWGACVGWTLAALFTAFAKAGFVAVPLILGNPGQTKPLEKLFYLSCYIVCPICAYLAPRFSSRLRNAWATALSVALFLLFAPWIAAAATSGGLYGIAFLYWLVVPLIALASPFFVATPVSTTFEYHDEMAWNTQRFSMRDGVWLLGSCAFFAACLFPIDTGTVIARIGYNMHVVSFYIGPALFTQHRGLIPGIDFFPQYGIGIGAFFSLFLRPFAGATIANTVFVTAGLCVFYFTSVFFVLGKLYRSRAVAFAVVLFGLLLCFHLIPVFLDPSSWPARYPFLFLFVWTMSLAVGSKMQAASLVAAGAVAGLCLFWNTETGIYAVTSSVIATVLLSSREATTMARNLGAVAAGCVGAFFVLAFIAYGPGIFQAGFLFGLIKPLSVYSEGLASASIEWRSPFNFLIAVVSPVLGFATMGWTAAAIVRNETTYSKRTLIVLFLLAFLGNCLMLKWVNKSIDALGYVNAMPMLAVAAWWIQASLRAVRQRFNDKRVHIGVAAAGVGLLVSAFLFLCFVRDDENPTKYALQSFVVYPSILIGAFEGGQRYAWDPNGEASSADVALLEHYASAANRVSVVSPYDWVYLLRTRSVPRIPWIPSTTIRAFPFLVRNGMFDGGPIFLDSRAPVETLEEPLRSVVKDAIRSRYRSGPTGTFLHVFLER